MCCVHDKSRRRGGRPRVRIRWDRKEKEEAAAAANGRREISRTLSRLPKSSPDLHIGVGNSIGVYGQCIENVKIRIENNGADARL